MDILQHSNKYPSSLESQAAVDSRQSWNNLNHHFFSSGIIGIVGIGASFLFARLAQGFRISVDLAIIWETLGGKRSKSTERATQPVPSLDKTHRKQI